MQIETDDGVLLNVVLEGAPAAPPLILSNSLGTNIEMWSPQVAAFAERFRLIRYDTRGHGASAAPAGDYTIERLGRDVLAIADHLGIERFDYCGLSMGGMTGLWLGINAGHRLRRLVIANAAAFTGGPELWAKRIEMVRESGMGSMLEPIIPRWFTPAFIERQPDVVDRISRTLVGTDADGYIGCSAAIRDMDLRVGLSSIAVPTLLIGGLSDGGPPPMVLEKMAEIIPGARLVMLPASHLSNLEAADEFAAAVLGFLA